MEDGTIDLNGVDLGPEPNHDKDVEKNDKKRKRKAHTLMMIEEESVENACTSNNFLISECPTRWNSTHDMLKTAIELKDAFFDYDFNNSCFARDLEEIPKQADFEVCKKVVTFLEKFKETTELVSSVSILVAHLWFGEILDIGEKMLPLQK
ncbi:zinc finger BED domain-containing protein RICESLEEPER 2 [Tanacetum coccineum]